MKKKRSFDKIKKVYDNIKPKVKDTMNTTAVLRTGKRKIVYRPFKVGAAALAVIILIVLIGSMFFSEGKIKNVNVAFESGGDYSAKAVDDYMLIYNNRGAKGIDSDGSVKWEISSNMSEPFAESGGKYFLLADLSGNHEAASYKNGKKENDYQLGNDIISAKITEDGYAAFAVDTDGYKGKVSLFNSRGKEIYEWNSGSGYINDIDITDNGRYLVVAQSVISDEKSGTKIRVIDTSKGETVSECDRENEIAVEVKFVSSSKFVVVTDNHIMGYNRDCEEKFSISLEGKEPSLYSIESDDLIAVKTLNNMGGSTLELYSYSGKYKGAYVASGNIRNISVCDSTVAVVEQRGIVTVNSKGKAKNNAVSLDHDIKCIGFFDDEKNVIAIGSSGADVVKIR